MSDGKIIYEVEIDDDGAESKVRQTNEKLNSAANTGSGAFSEVWTGALRTIGGKLVELGQTAISSAVDVAKESLAQVASFEQNVGGVEKLFGESAGAVQENAKKAFETAGMSANEYMENVTGFSASLINSLGGDTEEAAKLADIAIRGMSDNANTFGTSLDSITVAYQGFAKGNMTLLDNLKLGYGGTKEEMARLVEDASKMTDVQKELGLTVDGTSMDFANIVKAIEVMQKSMNIAGTTSREAAGTIEGSVGSMKAAWTNFLTGTMNGEDFAKVAIVAADNIVKAFMEIIPRLIEGFASMTPTLISKAIEIVTNLATTIGEHKLEFLEKGAEFIRSIGEGLVQGIPQFLQNALPMVEQFTASLRENAGKFVDSGIEFILNLMQGLMDSLPTLIEYVPTIISNVVNIINDNAPKLLEMGVKLLVMLGQGIVQAIPALIENFPKIIQMILDVWQAINWLDLGKFVINGIKGGVGALAKSIPDLMKSIGETAKNIIQNIDWKTLGRTIINFIVTGIKMLVMSIPDVLKTIGNTALNGFKSIDWQGVGTAVINGIIRGLRNGIGWIIDAARDVARAAFDAACSWLGIHSPSRKFKEVGEYSAEGQAIGMLDSADEVEKASKEVAERALNAQMDVNYKLPDIDSANRDMSASLSNTISSTVQRVIEVPLYINSKEIARATAWDMGEQLAWEMR